MGNRATAGVLPCPVLDGREASSSPYGLRGSIPLPGSPEDRHTDFLAPLKQRTVRYVMLQTMKSNEFYGLF